MNGITLVQLLLSGSINYLVHKKQVDLIITKARLEQRDILASELDALLAEVDRVAALTDERLDAAAQLPG